MRTISETRMECLRLANTLATAKVIGANEVQTKAEQFFAWVQDDAAAKRASPEQVEGLKERFR